MDVVTARTLTKTVVVRWRDIEVCTVKCAVYGQNVKKSGARR